MSRSNLLIAQLNSLLRLTNVELMIAETRRSQAATPQIERDLERNADACRTRSDLLGEAVRDLGGVPDALGLAVGRAGAVLKAAAEQGQDLDEALLGDLALEHQLRDRARFAGMLAEQLGERRTTTLMDRVERAHTETIEWLMERLGEIAVGGPPGLRPTPVQVAVGLGRRAVQVPARQAASVLNRSVQTTRGVRSNVAETVSSNVARTRELASAAREIWTAGRDASLQRSERLAAERGDRDTASSIHRTRGQLGALDAAELPIRNYDSLTAAVVGDRIERLTDADDVRAVLAYEAANKERKGVIADATRRLEVLAVELAAAS